MLRCCVGHSAAVRHLDWSADSSALVSTAQDGEILYWTAATGKPAATDMRDTRCDCGPDGAHPMEHPIRDKASDGAPDRAPDWAPDKAPDATPGKQAQILQGLGSSRLRA